MLQEDGFVFFNYHSVRWLVRRGEGGDPKPTGPRTGFIFGLCESQLKGLLGYEQRHFHKPSANNNLRELQLRGLFENRPIESTLRPTVLRLFTFPVLLAP